MQVWDTVAIIGLSAAVTAFSDLLAVAAVIALLGVYRLLNGTQWPSPASASLARIHYFATPLVTVALPCDGNDAHGNTWLACPAVYVTVISAIQRISNV